jgi:hypothetical protein
MDIVKVKIPYEFARSRVRLSWRDVLFGLENELIDGDAPQAMAINHKNNVVAHSTLLSGLTEGDDQLKVIKELARSEPERTDDQIRDAWLYLVLAWLYERRNELADPLQCVEEVYADFGYPVEIAPFVRYMPMDGPDLGSREANERRLYERWAQYLDNARSLQSV